MNNKIVIIGLVVLLCVVGIAIFFSIYYDHSDAFIEIDWTSSGYIGGSKGKTFIKKDGRIYIDKSTHTRFGNVDKTENKKYYSEKTVSSEDLSLMKEYVSLIKSNDCKEHPEKNGGMYVSDYSKNSSIYIYNNMGKFKLFDKQTVNSSVYANKLLELIDKYDSIYISNKKWTAE